MSSLTTYRSKRDFRKTDEPAGAAAKVAPKSESAFVIQKHAASRLHYDLRLQIDGVLKSWAVPKGPSLDPTVRRLAVHVEDHPLEYGSFEGVIPEGEYGGGVVMVWDAGRWEPLGDAEDAYARGELKFRLEGHKLRGAWALVRMKPKKGAGKRSADDWLLIKERDDEARPGDGDPWSEDDRSVSTQRTMLEIAAGRRPRARRRTGRTQRPDEPGAAPLPDVLPTMLATLVERPPDGDEWLHEIKYDGYRILARIEGGRVNLLTRGGLDWTDEFGALTTELAKLKAENAMLDGEVVVLRPDGLSDFGALQRSLSGESERQPTYMVFDLLYLDGVDTRRLPLVARKERLARLLGSRRARPSGLVRLSEHIRGSGPEVFEAACERELEGIVSKRRDGHYEGVRSRAWLKTKCRHRQEVVVGGYTEPSGSRSGFGALAVGTYDDEGHLKYAGKVGSGFSDADLQRLTTKLKALRRRTSPFAQAPRLRGAHWVTPRLVVEVAFAGWTAEGRLRQAVFKGVREDKPAAQVRREAASSPARDDAGGAALKVAPAPEADAARPADVRVAGVRITHPRRQVYPDVGMTKADVAEYYEAIGEHMLPHLAGRPLTVVRCPAGADDECFFQKHAPKSLTNAVGRVSVREKRRTSEYPVVNDVEGLISLVQLGAVEFHIWGSRADSLEEPDRLVFDLDPSPEVDWKEVRSAARRLRTELAANDLQSVVMTSGGKGLHVVAPLTRGPGWEAVGTFARAVVDRLVARHPGEYTATMSKQKRVGKIFIDHLRNRRGATAVAPYSLRSRPGAPVATPLEWRELNRTSGGAVWTAPRVLRRLRARTDDAWGEVKPSAWA